MPHLFTTYFVNSELATRVISSECCMYIVFYLLKSCFCETNSV